MRLYLLPLPWPVSFLLCYLTVVWAPFLWDFLLNLLHFIWIIPHFLSLLLDRYYTSTAALVAADSHSMVLLLHSLVPLLRRIHLLLPSFLHEKSNFDAPNVSHFIAIAIALHSSSEHGLSQFKSFAFSWIANIGSLFRSSMFNSFSSSPSLQSGIHPPLWPP